MQVLNFRQTLDDLNTFMINQSLPGEMKRRLRRFFHQRRSLMMSKAASEVVGKLSSSLQRDVISYKAHTVPHAHSPLHLRTDASHRPLCAPCVHRVCGYRSSCTATARGSSRSESTRASHSASHSARPPHAIS